MSTGSTQPFNPAATVSIAATTASQQVLSGVPVPAFLGGPDAVLVYNSGTTLAFVAFGNGAAVATAANGFPVPPGASRLIAVGNGNVNAAAAIMLSGTGTVYFSFGTGTVY
jgi:hypothetical protein